MSLQLKILDQRHKQKLNLKALDAVLFGPPQREYTAPFVQPGCLAAQTEAAVSSRPPSCLQVPSTTG